MGNRTIAIIKYARRTRPRDEREINRNNKVNGIKSEGIVIDAMVLSIMKLGFPQITNRV